MWQIRQLLKGKPLNKLIIKIYLHNNPRDSI